MTRWARGNAITRRKPQDASSWAELKQSVKVDKPCQPKEKPLRTNEGRVRKKTGSRYHMANKPDVGLAPMTKKQLKDKKLLQIKIEETTGLAAQLERLHDKGAHADQKSPLLDGKVNTKTDKSKKFTGLAAAMEEMMAEFGEDLTKEQEREMQNVIKKDKRTEDRRVKRIKQRESGKICFHCRESGHSMEDCPQLQGDPDAGTGICFKCGSTEHFIQKCQRKLPPGEFPYAKCFICGEQGHMSKQCPDNPRGLYPNGGCCRICGSVEHFKKDCPELQRKQGINDWKLATLNDVKGMDDDVLFDEPKVAVPVKKRSKIVKF